MKRKVPESLKKQVAYEQEYKCNVCKYLLPSSYQIDHVIPHSISGDDSRANLVALCPTCHANKTQKECTRIMYYKRLVATYQCVFCYFCLTQMTDPASHNCGNTLLDIPSSKTPMEISSLYKFAHVDILSSEVSRMDLTDGHILKIHITNDSVKINDYSAKVVDKSLTPHDLGNIIRKATVGEVDKYTEVHIDIIVPNDGGTGGEACIEYFSEILPSEVPKEIFKNTEITYVYFCDDD